MNFTPDFVANLKTQRAAIEKQIEVFGGSTADQRLLTSIDEKLIFASEPPLAEGCTRLYRGEGLSKVKLPEWAQTNAGQWFSTRRQKAVDFQEARQGRLLFLDVPSKDLAAMSAPRGNNLDEYLIPQVTQKNLGLKVMPAQKASMNIE